jgi:hypothetical protein
VWNAAAALQAELLTDLIKKEFPGAETSVPRVLWWLLMLRWTNRAERSWLKQKIAEVSREGATRTEGYKFEPWKDEASWKIFLEALEGPTYEALKSPSRAERKEMLEGTPMFPEDAKRRKSVGGKTGGGNSAASAAESATVSATVSATPTVSSYALSQSSQLPTERKDQKRLSGKELQDCQVLLANCPKPTPRGDGTIQDFGPPCAVCKKYFSKVTTNKGFLYDSHPTHRCRVVQIIDGKAVQSSRPAKRRKIGKKK